MSGIAAPGDQATIAVLVAVEPAVAFEVFTQEIDLWWRRGLVRSMGMWWGDLVTSLREHAAARTAGPAARVPE